MKIKSVRIKNFRGYKSQTSIDFANLTAFVGKNDIGKSTVLEALDIFFNEGKGIIKLDKDDINKFGLEAGEDEIEIAVIFDELPDEIIIDSTNKTTLQDEYLLNGDGNLEIIKRYPNASSAKVSVFAKANHPTNDNCSDLLLKKDTELKKLIENLKIDGVDKNKNATMRRAIWNHYKDELQLCETEIEINKGDTKSIWDGLKNYLPLYSLFQSDRKNSDGDSEVQDPLKEAVKQILNNGNLKQKFGEIAKEVQSKLEDVSTQTLAKLNAMNPGIAKSLNPMIPTADSLKWTDVFKNVSIYGDGDIPVNKRGSGVKRLILLSFFQAEVERLKKEKNLQNIIYAIEEPETSQHTEHQKQLIKSFLALSETAKTQIIITTHSAVVVKELDFKYLRLIKVDSNGQKLVESVQPGQLSYPSLNEVNYLAFNEVTEEYHNELYGFIESEGKLGAFKNKHPKIKYTKQHKKGSEDEQITLTEYIRHQIHHPENKHNARYSHNLLEESIILMRAHLLENSESSTV